MGSVIDGVTLREPLSVVRQARPLQLEEWYLPKRLVGNQSLERNVVEDVGSLVHFHEDARHFRELASLSRLESGRQTGGNMALLNPVVALAILTSGKIDLVGEHLKGIAYWAVRRTR